MNSERKGPGKPKKQSREERLNEALRANLRRRKAGKTKPTPPKE